MPVVLVTGYEPFSTYDRNPSRLVAQELDGTTYGDVTVIGRVMPVDLHAMPPLLERLVEDHRPDIVLSLGLAGGIAGINVERVAINLADLTRIPDNTGLAVADMPLVPGGPDALFATVPTRRIVDRLRTSGIPAALSYSAGTNLCNAALYHALLLAQRHELSFRAGFLHVPLLPEQAAQRPDACPSMDLATMRRAVEIAIESALGELPALPHGGAPAVVTGIGAGAALPG